MTTPVAVTADTAPGRRHDIDALRAIAFGLLILYHVGMFYVPWDWHVKSVHIAPWLETPMLLLNQWRMPLVFMVSGLAVNPFNPFTNGTRSINRLQGHFCVAGNAQIRICDRLVDYEQSCFVEAKLSCDQQ